MIPSDRQQQIKELLLEYKHVDVSTLCNVLHISSATVRRDLNTLEKQGFLLKTYGGAVLSDTQHSEIYLSDGQDPYEKEKRAIAALAANLIHDGDSIFLGGGEICVLLARQLCTRSGLNVVTNNVNAFLVLAQIPGIHVLLAGGSPAGSDDYPETTGEITKELLSSMYFDTVLFSCDGISFRQGYSLKSLDRLNIIRCALERTNSSILLADTSKFDAVYLHSVAKLNEISKLVTYVGAPEAYKLYFLQNNISLYEACME